MKLVSIVTFGSHLLSCSMLVQLCTNWLNKKWKYATISKVILPRKITWKKWWSPLNHILGHRSEVPKWSTSTPHPSGPALPFWQSVNYRGYQLSLCIHQQLIMFAGNSCNLPMVGSKERVRLYSNMHFSARLSSVTASLKRFEDVQFGRLSSGLIIGAVFGEHNFWWNICW